MEKKEIIEKMKACVNNIKQNDDILTTEQIKDFYNTFQKLLYKRKYKEDEKYRNKKIQQAQNYRDKIKKNK